MRLRGGCEPRTHLQRGRRGEHPARSFLLSVSLLGGTCAVKRSQRAPPWPNRDGSPVSAELCGTPSPLTVSHRGKAAVAFSEASRPSPGAGLMLRPPCGDLNRGPRWLPHEEKPPPVRAPDDARRRPASHGRPGRWHGPASRYRPSPSTDAAPAPRGLTSSRSSGNQDADRRRDRLTPEDSPLAKAQGAGPADRDALRTRAKCSSSGFDRPPTSTAKCWPSFERLRDGGR